MKHRILLLALVTLCVAALATCLATLLAEDPNDPVGDELAKLTGTYRLVRGEEGGMPVADDIVRRAKLTINAQRHSVQLGDESIVGTHTVNPLETPKSIDATDTMGRFAGKTTKGIYKLEQDQLTVCFAPPGEPRPTDFVTQDFPGRLLHVWQRVP